MDEDETLEIEGDKDNPTQLPRVFKKRKVARRSEVWNHFLVIENEEGEAIRAICNYCKRNYAANSGRNGTSTLRTHLTVCPDHPNRVEKNLPINRFCQNSNLNLPPVSQIRYDPEMIRKALARMIIVDELPFRFVESEGFRYFMGIVLPQFSVPSRGTITNDCFKLYFDEKQKMREFFKQSKQRVSLTTDTWTSNQRISYLCLTAHFIDEGWKLQKMILNFIPCDSHKGHDVGLQIEKCLLDWGIENVFTITVDNASSNDTTVAYLKKRFISWKKVICEGRFLHMRCMAHIINLVVKDGLKEMSISVERIRTLVRYVRQSPQRLKRFKDLADEENIESKRSLCLDCPTRWNSVFVMLETALIYQEVFHRFAIYEKELTEDFRNGGPFSIGLPTVTDWKAVERLLKVLQHFYELTMRVSGSLYVTSNDFLEEISDVDFLLKEWIASDDSNLVNVAKKMKEKFDKYWGDPEKMNMLLFLPVALDPRHKIKYLTHVLKDMYENEVGGRLCVLVRTALNDVFEEYKKMYGPRVSTSSQSNTRSGTSEADSSDSENNFCKRKKGFRKEKFRMLQGEEGMTNDESELEKYLSEKTENDKDSFDVLDWWKLNGPRFPVLSRMARDFFAIPISTVASESAFSTGGRIIDDFRSSLTPRITQALICYQDWIRHNPVIPVEENYDSIEKIEHSLLQNVGLESTILGL